MTLLYGVATSHNFETLRFDSGGLDHILVSHPNFVKKYFSTFATLVVQILCLKVVGGGGNGTSKEYNYNTFLFSRTSRKLR